VLKWRLMVGTLPFVAAVTLVKFLLEYLLHFDGIVEFAEVGIVLTGGVFLTGFMLAGTMSDYKESEKLPGELACTLETLEEVLAQATIARPNIAVAPLRVAVLEATQKLGAWLRKSVPYDEAFVALTRLGGVIQQVEREGGGAYASRAISELHNLRKTVTRIAVISRTGFLPPAYALLETLMVIILVLLLAAKFKSSLAEYILVPFVTLIYVYMLRLIRDVDDPFDYAPDGQKGGAEVELFPLDEFRGRIEARVNAEASAPVARAVS
jgi:hypothetical protein